MNHPPPSPAPSVKPRILAVDDVLQNLQVVGTMLRNEGYDVMPAGSGRKPWNGCGCGFPT